jgi:hypothetical protein
MSGNVGLQDLTLFTLCENVVRANQAMLELAIPLSDSSN